MNYKSVVNALDMGASGSEVFLCGKSCAGSNKISVPHTGDFKAGQFVTVENCFYHTCGMRYNDKAPYLAKNQSPLRDEIEIEGIAQDKLRQVFILHFTGGDKFSFMTIDPVYQNNISTYPGIRNTWCFQGVDLPITDEWTELTDSVRIRFRKKDYLPGECISFHVRKELYAQILRAEGDTLELDRCANLDCDNVLIRHHDNEVLQAALDLAVREKKTLYIPAGRYRLNKGLWLRHANVCVEGEDRAHTILDVSDANTACFWVGGGDEFTVKKMTMVGHTSFMELPSMSSWKTAGGFDMWPTANQQMEIAGCSAVNAVSVQHMLFEDLDIRRMASEAIYLHGSSRKGDPPYIQGPHEDIPGLDKQYQKTCVIHRCNGYDCGFNLFNNNDTSEATLISECRAERVGNFCENGAQFCRFTNNHIIDGCMLTICTSGSAVISGNIFESGAVCGALSISAPQVILENNIFYSYSKETPVWLSGKGPIQVRNNIISLTAAEGNVDHVREGVHCDAKNVIISGNQITGFGKVDICGIQIGKDAENVLVKDNVIKDCTTGIRFGNRHFNNELGKWTFHPCAKGESIHVRENIFFNCEEDVKEESNEVKVL